MQSANRFFVIPKFENHVLPWNVHAAKPENFPRDCDYFGKVFAILDQKLDAGGLDILMTWSLDQIPMRGKNVVVFLIGDEKSQIPAFAGQVKAVFKTGGIKPFYPINLTTPLYSTLEVMRVTRNRLIGCKRSWNHGFRTLEMATNIFPIPLGCCASIDLPMIPIAQRNWDVFFAGWIQKPQWNKPQSWQLSPRVYSRNQLGQAVTRLKQTHPTVTCNFTTSRSRRLSPLEYATQLADSRICLVPRGNFHETYRFLEAARAGCILISEPVPDLWYYQDHPAVVVQNWNRLDEVIHNILASEDRMAELHKRSVAWWQKRVCETAVAEYIVQTLQPRERRPQAVTALAQ